MQRFSFLFSRQVICLSMRILLGYGIYILFEYRIKKSFAAQHTIHLHILSFCSMNHLLVINNRLYGTKTPLLSLCEYNQNAIPYTLPNESQIHCEIIKIQPVHHFTCFGISFPINNQLRSNLPLYTTTLAISLS
jgi:hypothetical protein